MGSHESRRRAKVVRGRIDGFAPPDCLDNLWRPMPQAE
jgi:hypothetical protein